MLMQKLVCYSTHSATFPAWNCNSGTHYHVEKGTLGCITDIKEQFQNLVYELKPRAIKTYSDLHGRLLPLPCPQGRGASATSGLKYGMGLFRNFYFREPVLTMTYSSLAGDVLNSQILSPQCGYVFPSWKACGSQRPASCSGLAGSRTTSTLLRTPWQQQCSALLNDAKMLPFTQCSVHCAIHGQPDGPGAEMLY